MLQSRCPAGGSHGSARRCEIRPRKLLPRIKDHIDACPFEGALYRAPSATSFVTFSVKSNRTSWLTTLPSRPTNHRAGTA